MGNTLFYTLYPYIMKILRLGLAVNDNQPGRQLHKLGPAVRRCEPALDQIGKGWARTHRRRYSLDMGCLLAGASGNRRRLR